MTRFTKAERRAEHLAEKYGLSQQLTLIWVEKNPKRAARPMMPRDVAALKTFARVSAA